MSLNIQISAEPIFSLGNFSLTNSMLMSLTISVVLSLIAISFSRAIKSRRFSGWHTFIQTLVESFYEFVRLVAPQQGTRLFPLIATIFFFVMLGSWVGLLPGAETIKLNHAPLIRGGTADLNITLGLALFAVASIQYYCYQTQGMKYFKKFINLSNPINFFVGILEILSEFARIMSFAFRLFGNIFAGEVLLAVIAFLVPLAAPLPFLGLEIFVGFIQALVFATLTLVFINIAVESHH